MSRGGDDLFFCFVFFCLEKEGEGEEEEEEVEFFFPLPPAVAVVFATRITGPFLPIQSKESVSFCAR